MVRLGDVSPAVWDTITERMEILLAKFKFKAEKIAVDWRIQAAKFKLERELFEQYGVWKDIILHPNFQYAKQLAEDNIDFSFQLGDPIIPFATVVIILVMMNKRVSNTILALMGGFMLNVNPFYVFLSLMTWYQWSHSKRPRQYMKPSRRSAATPTKNELKPTPFQIGIIEKKGLEYDHVLIGSDIGTLYCAALLSRVGHRCCVLMPRGVHTLEIQPKGASCAIPLYNLCTGKIDKYQSLLDLATVKDGRGKVLNRTVFSPVGNEVNGYLSCVLRPSQAAVSKHLGALQQEADESETELVQQRRRLRSREKLWTLRAGENSFASDVCTVAAADKATAFNLFRALIGSLQFSFSYLFAKSLQPKDLKAVIAQEGAKTFFDVAQSSIFSFFGTGQKYEEAYSAVSSVGVYAAEEALLGSDCSCVCLAAGLGHTEEGIFYPVGGPGRLQANLIRVILSAGGDVYSDVPVSAIETLRGDDDPVAHAVGVKLNNGKDDNTVLYGSRSVISGVGALCTYLRLLPEDELTEDTRAALSKLTEARPKLHVLYWLDGTSEELGLSDADFIETLENVTDESTSASRKEFSKSYVRIWSPSMKDPSWKERNGTRLHAVVVETEAQSPIVALRMHKYAHEPRVVAPFAPAIDTTVGATLPPSHRSVGPQIFDASKATPVEDPSLVSVSGYTVQLSEHQMEEAQKYADEKLFALYPKSRGHVGQRHLVPPSLGGRLVSNTSYKYSSPLTSQSDVQGLYLCGRDMSTFGLSGDVQSGWVTANAVLGYTSADLLAGRNVASDLSFVK